jgi:replicative DNA helicase
MQSSEVGALFAERKIREDHFHLPESKAVYRVLQDHWIANRPTDPLTVTISLRNSGQLESVGGPVFVSELSTLAPGAAFIGEYLNTLEEKFIAREILAVTREFGEEASAASEPRNVLNRLAGRVAEIAGASVRAGHKSLREALHDKVDRLERQEDAVGTIHTGISKLDQHSPLKRGDMPLLTGERKAGKSIAALTIAANVALAGEPVLYFSLEDRQPKVIDRLLAGVARVPTIKDHTRLLTDADMAAIVRGIGKLDPVKFDIRDDVFDLSGIVAAARQFKAKHPDMALIVVDYAQLVRAEVKKNDTREREVAAVSRTLRLLAMELDTALILLCQLNSAGESRESRALEQDATACWRIAQIPTNHKGEPETYEHGKRMLVVPWQRNGESGITFPVTFLGHIARVEDYQGE